MRSALPGKSSSNTVVALTKAALRIFRLADVADAIGDLAGLGQANIKSFVRMAEEDLAKRPSAEFTAVAAADREWVEGVLARTYIGLAADPARLVMGESLIGAEAVVRLADKAMTAADRRDVDAASGDVRAYLTAVSWSIAYLISEWYSTNEDPNRAAMSQATGETLQTVREIQQLLEALRTHFDSSFASALVQLEQSTLKDTCSSPDPEPERIVFELDFGFAPLATEAELAELVSAAFVAVLEDRPVLIEVSLPPLDEDVKELGDALHVAQLKRRFQNKARRLRLTLTAFFSPQVEAAWAPYLQGVPARVTVVRAILTGQEETGARLQIWRSTPALPSVFIQLTPDEVHAVVESVGLGHWDHLKLGAGWRAADELPRSVIVEKVMPGILTELVRWEKISDENWAVDMLFLPSWHIGAG